MMRILVIRSIALTASLYIAHKSLDGPTNRGSLESNNQNNKRASTHTQKS